MDAEIGDKVRLKNDGYAGKRGIVEAVNGSSMAVRIDGASTTITVQPADVTNFSLAARKAWQNMPHRPVGRPKGSRHCDRVSVTLRIDRELWSEFRLKESEGLIEDRTAAINAWLRRMLETIDAEGRTRATQDQ